MVVARDRGLGGEVAMRSHCLLCAVLFWEDGKSSGDGWW